MPTVHVLVMLNHRPERGPRGSYKSSVLTEVKARSFAYGLVAISVCGLSCNKNSRSVEHSKLAHKTSSSASPAAQCQLHASSVQQQKTFRTSPEEKHVLQQTIALLKLDRISSATFSVSGDQIAVGDVSGQLFVASIASLRAGGANHPWKAHQSQVRSIAFTPEGDQFVSGDALGRVLLWKTTNGALLRVVQQGGAPVRSLALSTSHVAVASEQSDVKVISLRSVSADASVLHTTSQWVRAVSFSADGGTVATGDHSGHVRLWSFSSQGLSNRLLGKHRLWVSAVAFSDDGRWLASAGFDKQIIVWDLQHGRPAASLLGHVREVVGLRFDRSGLKLASSGVDRQVRVWNWRKSETLAKYAGEYQLQSVAFSADSSRIMSISSVGLFYSWEYPPHWPRHLSFAAKRSQQGIVAFRCNTTGERHWIPLVDSQGKINPKARQMLAIVLRSRPDDAKKAPTLALVDLIVDVSKHFGFDREIVVISGYRSPLYNKLRSNQSRQVSQNSRHMHGEAIDLRIEGVPITMLFKFIRSLKRGGVGLYADSQFVHMDVGSVRVWHGN